MRATLIFLWFAVMALLMVTCSHESYIDEIRSQSLYCDMVQEGTWPDYKNIYDKSCASGEGRP